MTSPRANRQHLRSIRLIGAAALIAVVATACSASTSVESVIDTSPAAVDAATSAPEPTAAAEPGAGAASETDAVDDAASSEAGEETEAAAPAAPTATWDGPNVAPLLDARMAELAAPFGAPFAPDAVAAIFATPTDFPYPEGTITGIIHTWDLDERVTDEVDIEEERIIGLAGDPSDTILDAIADSVGEGSDSRWGRSSKQRQEGQAWNDLFTAEDGDGDGATDRLVLTSDIAPDPDESDVKISVEFEPDTMPETPWMAGLPIPEGGRLVEVLEGMGLVKDFGRPGGNGTITARWSYPVEAVPDLVEFLNSGVVGAAGFEHEDLTVTADDPTDRFDVAIGDWEGQLIVSTFSIGDADPAGYHVMWNLSRS